MMDLSSGDLMIDKYFRHHFALLVDRPKDKIWSLIWVNRDTDGRIHMMLYTEEYLKCYFEPLSRCGE